MTLCRNQSINGSSSRTLSEGASLGGTDPTGRRTAIRLLRLGEVLQLTGLGKTKIYELQSEGSFPMRVQITSRSVGWIEQEVQEWLNRRVATSNSLPIRNDSKPLPSR